MKRSAKGLATRIAVAIAMLGALGPTAALGQAPTAKPKAEAPKEAPKPGAKDAPAGTPSGTPASAPPAGTAGALPAGHPPVGDEGEGLPAGHPPVDDNAPAPARPHGRSAGAMGLYEPPPDTAEDDPSLPAGAIVITIKDAEDRPIPRAPITLGVLHSSVARGESRERLAREADDSGQARFDGLGFGSGTTYRVSTTRGPASYAVTPFALGDKVGKRVTLHAYEVSGNLDGLLIGAQGAVYVGLREGAIQVEQLLSVFNLGPTSWAADATFALPAGFKAFNKQESMDDVRVDEVKDKGVALRGTVSPGRHDVTFRYQIPLDGNEKQTIRIELPPRVAMARVIAEASKSMELKVAGFPDAQRVPGRDGKRLLLTERQVARAEGGLTALEITLSGLPTPGNGRWVAVALALAALGGGFFYAFHRRDDDALDEDTRADLVEAREALLDEIVALERAHRSGEVGPKTYARVRASLLDALARIVERLDRAAEAATPETPKTPEPPRKPRAAEVT